MLWLSRVDQLMIVVFLLYLVNILEDLVGNGESSRMYLLAPVTHSSDMSHQLSSLRSSLPRMA